jgi:hypothetical protein
MHKIIRTDYKLLVVNAALYEHNRKQVHEISESLKRSVASIAESGSAGSARLA